MMDFLVVVSSATSLLLGYFAVSSTRSGSRGMNKAHAVGTAVGHVTSPHP
jgi:hypothetical protein